MSCTDTPHDNARTTASASTSGWGALRLRRAQFAQAIETGQNGERAKPARHAPGEAVSIRNRDQAKSSRRRRRRGMPPRPRNPTAKRREARAGGPSGAAEPAQPRFPVARPAPTAETRGFQRRTVGAKRYLGSIKRKHAAATATVRWPTIRSMSHNCMLTKSIRKIRWRWEDQPRMARRGETANARMCGERRWRGRRGAAPASRLNGRRPYWSRADYARCGSSNTPTSDTDDTGDTGTMERAHFAITELKSAAVHGKSAWPKARPLTTMALRQTGTQIANFLAGTRLRRSKSSTTSL